MTSKDSPNTIDEEELRRALRADAELYDVPPDGPEAVRTAIRAHAGSPDGPPVPSVSWAQSAIAPGRGRKITMALAGIAAAVVLALLIGSISRNRSTDSTALRSTNSSGAVAKSAPPNAFAAEGKAAATTVPASGLEKRASGGVSSSNQSAASRAGAATDRTANPSSPSAKSTAADDAGSEKIVKTGSIELEVPRQTFSDRISSLTSVTKGLGGFVAETSTSEQSVTPTGTITLRVPADRFETLLVQVRRLGKVRSATSAAEDVTSEYTDVTGRLKTMTDERDSLNLVLTDAKNVPDILAVRDRLNGVQTEIEQLEGRRKVLDDQAALATLTVSLHEPSKAAPPPRPAPQQSGLSRAWDRAVDGFTGGAESMVAGSGKVLLVVLCAAGLWLVGRPVWHRFRRALV